MSGSIEIGVLPPLSTLPPPPVWTATGSEQLAAYIENYRPSTDLPTELMEEDLGQSNIHFAHDLRDMDAQGDELDYCRVVVALRFIVYARREFDIYPNTVYEILRRIANSYEMTILDDFSKGEGGQELALRLFLLSDKELELLLAAWEADHLMDPLGTGESVIADGEDDGRCNLYGDEETHVVPRARAAGRRFRAATKKMLAKVFPDRKALKTWRELKQQRYSIYDYDACVKAIYGEGEMGLLVSSRMDDFIHM